LLKKKIIIVGPSLKMGGIERASCNIANELSDINFKVIYLALFKQEVFFRLNNEVEFDEPDEDGFTRKINLIKTLRRVRRKVILSNPDQVLVFSKFYAAIVNIALIGTHYRIFLSERSSPHYKWPLRIRLISYLSFRVRAPKGIIAQTQIAAKIQRLYYGSQIPIEVIPNAVRKIRIMPETKREHHILAVGRMNDYLKGFERLLDVMPRVNPAWDLVFVGADKNENLQAKIDKLGLKERVRFAGQQSDMDIVYARAGMFVITSISEGFPNALCEAMAAGVPCVSYDFVAGPRDLINPGVNGILVEDGNLEKLAEVINALIDNDNLRIDIGENAKNMAQILDGKVIAKRVSDFLFKTESV
jgi:GalNAc-alpha-(1->4)-GalNAc-alpha-(1->3)-diNAcBac-PP-undecaprenol alpha-1,4-N-acetyl-D-galactosaminyltransferase